jgi:hypothetical protein
VIGNGSHALTAEDKSDNRSRHYTWPMTADQNQHREDELSPQLDYGTASSGSNVLSWQFIAIYLVCAIAGAALISIFHVFVFDYWSTYLGKSGNLVFLITHGFLTCCCSAVVLVILSLIHPVVRDRSIPRLIIVAGSLGIIAGLLSVAPITVHLLVGKVAPNTDSYPVNRLVIVLGRALPTLTVIVYWGLTKLAPTIRR